MTWPIYPNPTTVHEIQAHNKRGTEFAGKVYAAAVDVWRDGVHLWRSYAPEDSETLDKWHDAELGEDVARNYDDGIWSARGVVNVDHWVIPKQSALKPVGSSKDLRNMLVTMLAIGQMPAHPAGLDVVPAANTLNMRLWRSAWPYAVFTFEADGVTVRAMVAQLEVAMLSDVVSWSANLERRETREGAIDQSLGEPRTVEFKAPENADASSLVRAAKQSLGLTGWPAQRQGDSLVWHLARAPYTLTLDRIDG